MTPSKDLPPLREVVEKAAAPLPASGIGVAAEQNMRLSSSSSEFYKLYSPMADRMAEAARQSTNGACWTSVVCTFILMKISTLRNLTGPTDNF